MRFAALLAAGLVTAAALLAGCAADSVVLRTDASFVADSLTGRTLAVVGAVQKDEIAQVRAPLTAALEASLAAERPDIPLVHALQVREALGADTHRLLLNGFQALGTLDSAATAKLTGAIGGMARYAVVARVVHDVTRNSDLEIDRRDTTRVTGPARYARVARRDARVDVQVYDLRSRTLVFRGEYEGSSDAARLAPYALVRDLPTQPTGGSINIGPQGGFPPGYPDSLREEYDFPGPPPISMAAEPAFRLFVRALPRAAAGAAAPAGADSTARADSSATPR